MDSPFEGKKNKMSLSWLVNASGKTKAASP
jgi:hypothetical protein